MSLCKVDYASLQFNPMTMLAKEWMLLSAGSQENGFNTMTISWGQMGSLWGHQGGMPTTTVFVRPQRYTKEFMDREEYFTLSLFGPEYRKALGYLGSHSGKDEDKVAKTGLSPVFKDHSVWFEQAKLVFVCRKLYHGPIVPSGFVDPALIEENYPLKDFHEMYIGEIVAVYQDLEA